MAWPTVAVITTNMDADTDTGFRSDILDLTTKFNQLIAMRGVANGVCELDASSLVPVARLRGLMGNGYGEYTAGATLTSADLGRPCYYSSASGGTFPLPETGLTNGHTIEMYCLGPGAATLTMTTAALYARGSNAASLVLAAGDSIVLTWRTNAWFQVAETSRIAASATTAAACTGNAATATSAAACTGASASNLLSDAGSNGVGLPMTKCCIGAACASGATISGANLKDVLVNASGVVLSWGAAPSGLWRNVCGNNIALNEFGTFQRVS